MKKIVVVLALALVLGTVLISGCTTTQNNTQNNTGGNAQNNISGMQGYGIGQVVNIQSGNSEFNVESGKLSFQ